MPGSRSRDVHLSGQQVTAHIQRAWRTLQRSGYIMGSLKLAEEFRTLNLITGDDQSDAVAAVLNEISSEHYTGPHPPKHLAGEPVCKGARMLHFVWPSTRFGRTMFFKFCLSGKSGRERLVVLSLHEDYRPNYFAKLD